MIRLSGRSALFCLVPGHWVSNRMPFIIDDAIDMRGVCCIPWEWEVSNNVLWCHPSSENQRCEDALDAAMWRGAVGCCRERLVARADK